MKVYTCDQRSEEWRACRLGRLTGSCAAAMLSETKDPKTEAAGRRNLRVRLALERITGRSMESDFFSSSMKQGVEREPDALALYEAITGQLLTPVGFVAHDTLMAGCSPDGGIGQFDGLVEVKAPEAATHLEYLRTGRVPDKYLKQIRHNLWITEAPWCDFFSYCPDFKPALQSKLVRVWRDDNHIKSHELMARIFLREVDDQVAEIERLAEAAEAEGVIA